jgi:hypothetical protein
MPLPRVTAEGQAGRAAEEEEEEDRAVARSSGRGLEDSARRVVRTTGIAGARETMVAGGKHCLARADSVLCSIP